MAAGGGIVLAAGALAVFMGVVASLIFERTRLPDVVILLLAGILVGPILHLVDASAFAGFADVFTTLALAVILFEGGLDLNIHHIKRRLGLTTVLLITSYFATAAGVALAAVYGFGLTPSLGILFGLAMAPLSSSIVIPLVARLKVLPQTRAILTVESALGDVLAVLAVSITVDYLAGRGVEAESVLRSLGSSFVLGTVLAVAAGVVWLAVLKFLRGRPYTYMVTFAASLLVFALVEGAGGNGVVAILVFALVLGNAGFIANRFKWLNAYELDERIRWFHAEMSFFVRTFFFLYLGLLFRPDAFGMTLVFAGFLVVIAILAVRGAVVWGLIKQRPIERRDAGYLTFLGGRGLASAALATLPGVVALSAGTGFQDLAFVAILLTNLAMTAFIILREGGPGAGAEPEAAFFDLGELDIEGFHEVETGTRNA